MNPTIYCIGRNYSEHAKELGNPQPGAEPVVFLKAAAALRPLAAGPLAFPAESLHHEAELVVRLGRPLGLGEAGSWDDIDALALGLDLTRRQEQNRLKSAGLPWTSAKSFAGAAPLSDFIPKARFATLDSIQFSLTVNGQLRQQGDSAAMTFAVPALLRHLARYHPLRVGDLVFTGTPAGVGPIQSGDEFVLTFTQINCTFHGRL